jgi:hypothetical protein
VAFGIKGAVLISFVSNALENVRRTAVRRSCAEAGAGAGLQSITMAGFRANIGAYLLEGNASGGFPAESLKIVAPSPAFETGKNGSARPEVNSNPPRRS